MAHRFKTRSRVVSYTPSRMNRKDAELRRLAMAIQNEAQLTGLMMLVDERMRQQGLERIRPWLKFKLSGGFRLPEPVPPPQ